MNKKQWNTIIFDYEKTSAFIDKLDKQIFQIRTWALVTCSGVLAYGISKSDSRVLFANLTIVLGFFVFEVIYKTFHESGLKKNYELEEIIQSELKKEKKISSTYIFGIGHEIEPPTISSMFNLIKNPNRWHIRLFYFMLCLATLVGLMLNMMVRP